MYLLCLAQVIKSYPERVLLSAGLMYRTDLSIFGGEGLASCYSINNEDSSILFLRSLIDNESTVEQVCLNNKLRVLSWKTLQEEVKIVVKWRCDNCSIEHAE